MNGYVKVFMHMLDSSVWSLGKDARLLWITFLLKKDSNHMVVAALDGLARCANLTVEETRAALEELLKPDPQSANTEHEGRRILMVGQNQYLVVSGDKYRALMSYEDRKEYKRVKEQERRDLLKEKRKALMDGAVGGVGSLAERNFVKEEKNDNQIGQD